MMRNHQRRNSAAAAVAIFLTLVGGSVALGAQAAKLDVTGTWALEVTTDLAGTTTPTVTLKQDGTKLTGHYSSATLGEADVTGTLNGQNIAFSFTANVQGMPIDVAYTGTVESKDAMNGKIVLAGLGEGTFTGKRK